MPLPEMKALCNAIMFAQNLSPTPSPSFFRLVYAGIVSEYVWAGTEIPGGVWRGSNTEYYTVPTRVTMHDLDERQWKQFNVSLIVRGNLYKTMSTKCTVLYTYWLWPYCWAKPVHRFVQCSLLTPMIHIYPSQKVKLTNIIHACFAES